MSRESDYKYPSLLVYKKTRWESYHRPIEGVQVVFEHKTKEKYKSQSQLPVYILLVYSSFIISIITFNNMILYLIIVRFFLLFTFDY